jgi:hypothetical protein
VEKRFVTLDVSYPEALRRVRADPDTSRVGSRDPQVLRFLHAQYMAALPFLNSSSVVVDADRSTAQELARSIAGTVPAGLEADPVTKKRPSGKTPRSPKGRRSVRR